ncbi:MAG TPA: glycosyltransferase [Polyangiaceae bacterium]|nr:glycosyltransferase [Polyangiaceae bacterium]
MRILFVAPFLPSPPRFGGQRRLDGLMRSLAKNHALTVLAFNATDPFTQLSLDATREYCDEVVTFPDMEFLDGRRKRLLQARSLLSPHSYEHLLVTRRSEFSARLRAFVASGRFDIVQIEFCQMAALRFPLDGSRRYRLALDEHNIEYDIVRRTAGAEVSATRRAYSSVNWRKLRREERASWRWVDGVSVTSERDASVLRQDEPRTALSVVPNGVDVDAFQPAATTSEAENLLFFGAMNYYPNQDGIGFFVEQVLPRILARRPRLKLWIVGPGSDALQRLRGPNVEVTGFVDAVEPYIDRASAVVVPLRIGGGTRLKIVEAMAKAKAIVSTRIGAEGIDLGHDEHALLADTPEDFAAQVERILTDAALAKRLGAAARELAVGRYSWPALAQGLEGFYGQLLAAPPKPAC